MSPCQHFVPTLFSSLAGGGQSHPARFKKWFLLPGKQRKGRQTAEFGLKRVWYLQTSRDGLRHHYCFTSRITELEQSLRIGFYTSIRKPSTHQPQCSDNNEVLSKGPAYCGGPVMKITSKLQKHLRRPCPTIFVTFRNQQARPLQADNGHLRRWESKLSISVFISWVCLVHHYEERLSESEPRHLHANNDCISVHKGTQADFLHWFNYPQFIAVGKWNLS